VEGSIEKKIIMKTILLSLPMVISLAATIGCAPVKAASELANRDAAFSLLMEAFGEVQGALIEEDYQTRLQAAKSVADSLARGHVLDLAKQERDLRLGKLQRQLAEIAVAYHYSRQTDQRDGAVSEREKIDPTDDARTFLKFVFVGAIQTGDETNAIDSVVVIRGVPSEP